MAMFVESDLNKLVSEVMTDMEEEVNAERMQRFQ